MKNRIAFTTATMLMACGMVFASTQGTLPGTAEQTEESVSASSVDPNYKLPGVYGTQETPNTGADSKGAMPGTGLNSGLIGRASQNADLLPGVETL